MTTHRAIVALSMIAALGLAITPRTAEAQANCDWYGKTAVKQQQDNERLKCDLKGPEWSSDLRAHMTWCASVAPDKWKIEAQKRDQALAQCAKK